MLRKIYLTSALEQLMAQGRIHRPSRAHAILRAVINDGAAALSDADRQFYDLELVPMIERAAAY
ncbi:hypothetical protein SAMN02745157_4575 [Kaistia soli DSM 19436]|uniref:Uncharacterized protein n=1 Tax=Kaistia soli DSM 19436 TaxID=1122133 RepID=A0A1M5LGK3_9HYPH|nr:hypothetical protein [Kaistia soli]SHG63503.1 hypothetical protein SAMN02745157_4575 [Kaistia soli DSM 19436]